MDNFYRVIFLLILSFYAQFSFASFPVDAMWRGVSATIDSNSDYIAALPLYCKSAYAASTGKYIITAPVPSPLVPGSSYIQGQCETKNTSGTTQYVYVAGTPSMLKWTAAQCPSHSTFTDSSTTCTCESGYTENASARMCIPTCTAPLVLNTATNLCADKCQQNFTGRTAGYTGHEVSGTSVGCNSIPDTTCMDGCTFNVSNSICSPSNGGYVSSVGSGQGVSCTTVPNSDVTDLTTNPPVPPTPTSCMAAGQSYITYAGTTKCVAPSTVGSAPVTKKDYTKSSVTNNTTAAGAQSSAGTTTTSQTATTNPDGTVTTVTIVTNPDGSKAATTTDQSIDSYCTSNPYSKMCGGTGKGSDPSKPFCEENPQSPMCKVSNWSGSCGAFACDGDAVQCAQAQAVWKANCNFDKMNEATAQSDLANSVTSGADPDQAAIDAMKSGGDPVDMQATFTSASGSRWLGSADLPPLTINAIGHSFNLDTSLLSQFLRALGYVFVSVAGVIGLRIIGSSSNI